MNDIGPPPVSRNNALVGRVKAILLTPQTEWPVIAAEPATIADIYKSYVMPLAAIGPVAGFIGSTAIGFSVVGTTYRVPVGTALVSAVIGFALALVGVYLLALIIDALAPTFGAVKDRTQAFKVAAYGWTAAWIVGIVGLIPALSILGLAGLYSFYLLYLGLPAVMKAPADKAVGYIVSVIVASIVISIGVSMISASVALSLMI